MIMKKTMMTAAILSVAALTAASFTGCGSIARTNSAAKAPSPAMPVVSAETAAAVMPAAEAAPAAVMTEAAAQEAAEAATAAASTEPAKEMTAQKAAKETRTDPTEPRDADFKWFTTGVYRVSTEGCELDTYYVFSDDQNGRVDTVSGIGIPFTYTQSRSGVVFYMMDHKDGDVMKIVDASMNAFTGTMGGSTYTFNRVMDADPASFDAAEYADAQAQRDDDGQNPVMNVIGSYSNGRAIMNVSAKGKNEAAVTVSWGSSALETTKWSMSGTVTQVGNTLVMDYDDCCCESFFFSEDGTLSQTVTEYTNGAGTITFDFTQAVWSDFTQDGVGCQVFSYLYD